MSSPRRRPPGRQSFSGAPSGGSYEDKWHQLLEYLAQPKKGKPKLIRIAGGVFTLYQHFVKFNKKDGSPSGFYEPCPDFDWQTGQFQRGQGRPCPICENFSDNDLPRELQMFGSYRYYFDAFDVTACKAGNTQNIFGVVWTNKYGKNDLAAVSDMTGHDVDDDNHGVAVSWHYDQNAKDARERMHFYMGQPMPIRWDDQRGLFVLSGGGAEFTGEPTDFASIVKIKSAEEIQADLVRLKCYQRLEQATGVSATPGYQGAPPVENQTQQVPPAQQQPVEASAWGGDAPVETAPVEQGFGAPAQAPVQQAPAPQTAPVDENWGSPDAAPPAAPQADTWTEEAPATADGGWGGTDAPAAPAPAPTAPATETFDDGMFEKDDGWGGNGSAAQAAPPAQTAPAAPPAQAAPPEQPSGATPVADGGWGDPAPSTTPAPAPQAPEAGSAPTTPAQGEFDPDAW